MAAHKKWTPEIVAKIEKMSFKMSRREIADKLGCTLSQIHDLIARLKRNGEWHGSGYSTNKCEQLYQGCDYNCENCPYPDCYIPDVLAGRGLDLEAFHR